MMKFKLAVPRRLWTTSEHSVADNAKLEAEQEEEAQHIHEDCDSKHVCEMLF